MKKNLFIVLFSLLSTASFSQIHVGGMIGFGSDIEQWGIGANAEFFLNEKMSIAPNLLLYFPEKRGGYKYSFWEVNGDFHYYFLSEDPVNIYGLAGLNLTTARVKINNSGDYDESNNELGLNLGLGVSFNVNNVLPFAELKYVAGDYDQAVVMLGVRFPVVGD